MKYELGEAEFHFTQDPDSCAEHDFPQELVVKVTDAGGGHYIVVETQRWAFDSPDDLAAMVADIRKRLGDWWR